MAECIALIRGINVGRAKRIAMADLRDLLVDMGYGNVRTLLNSGNVLFRSPRPNAGKIGLAIQEGIAGKFGVSVSVVVATAADLENIIRDNPLLRVAKDPSKHLVAFVADPGVLERARILQKNSWAPDAFAIGPRAAYLWCADGVIASKLLQAFVRRTADAATTRNWATVLKLQAAATAGREVSASSK